MTIPAISAPRAGEPDGPDDLPSVRLREEEAVRPSAARQVIAGALLTTVALGCVLLLPPLAGGAVLLTVAVLFLARRLIFSWVGGLAILVGVIMFIPVRRYALPIPLPFAL